MRYAEGLSRRGERLFASVEAVVASVVWWRLVGDYDKVFGKGIVGDSYMNKHKRRRIGRQTMWSCNALVAFGAGVHFAVGCIDFELLLEWSVNKH